MVHYDPLWSCMVFEILNAPIALLCPVRYQILADIESFAFLFKMGQNLPEIDWYLYRGAIPAPMCIVRH